MKTIKRSLLFLLVAMLLLTQLVACDKDDAVETETSAAEETTEAPADDGGEDDSKKDDSKKDDGKKDDGKKDDGKEDDGEFVQKLLLFNFKDGLGGTTSGNCNVTASDGVLHMVCNTETSTNRWDPVIQLDTAKFPITGSDYTTCEIRMKYDVSESTGGHKKATLFFWYGENSGDVFSIEHTYSTDTETDYITIKLDLSELLMWQNFNIYKIRFDAFECIGTADIDYIAFYNGDYAVGEDDDYVEAPPADGDTFIPSAPVIPVEYNFDTAGDLEGWTPNDQYSTAEVADGALHLVAGNVETDTARIDHKLSLTEPVTGWTYNTCTITLKYSYPTNGVSWTTTLFGFLAPNSTAGMKTATYTPSAAASEGADYVTIELDLTSWLGADLGGGIRLDLSESACDVYVDSIVFSYK